MENSQSSTQINPEPGESNLTQTNQAQRAIKPPIEQPGQPVNRNLPPTTSQPKSKKWLLVVFILVGLMMIGVGVAYQQGYLSLGSNPEPTSLPNPTASPSPEPTSAPTPTPETINSMSDFELQVGQVFSGRSYFQQLSDSYTSLNSPELQAQKYDPLLMQNNEHTYRVSLWAYKYSPGLIYENGYEGSTWKIDMDKWRNFLISQEVGKQIGIVYDSYWGDNINAYEKEYDVMNLGGYKFVVSDSHFQPSASFHHEYQTFDEKNNQFVDITLTFPTQKKAEDISSYPEVQQIYEQFENILNQNDKNIQTYLTLEEEINLAFKEQIKSTDQAEILILKKHENFITGMRKSKEVSVAFQFIAKIVDGKINIIEVANEITPCSVVEEHDIPKSIYGECYLDLEEELE